MEKDQAFSKQLGGLATRWLNRLRHDLYFRTEFVVMGILFFLCLTNVIILAITLRHSQVEVASAVVESVAASVSANANGELDADASSQQLFDELDHIRNENLVVVVSVSIIFTLIFGYIVARVALVPTREALTAEKQFIANVAHELRTPLSIIKANSEILLLEKKYDGDGAAMINSNIEELDRISGIINNLLTLNSFRDIEHMNFESVDLSQIIDDSVSKLRKLADKKHIEISIKETSPLIVWGNKSGLAQIATNLIKNAVVYTPKNGHVSISARALSHAYAEFLVQDDGIGIEHEKLRRIFEPFYQVDPSRSQNRGSSGLGLAIVSELVKIHRGKISIESTRHEGTIVAIELPTQQKKKGSDLLPRTPELFNRTFLDFSKNG